MRLIDADKLELKHFVQWADVVVGYNGTQPKHKHTDIIAYDISGAPTVEAIPIEWIINWLTKQNIPALHTCDDYDAVNMMIDDWEKENETD